MSETGGNDVRNRSTLTSKYRLEARFMLSCGSVKFTVLGILVPPRAMRVVR